MYSVNKKGMVPKPSAECLGAWIATDIVNMKDFKNDMLHDYWNVQISEYETAWSAAGDLMFKNFDQCHFKAVMEDVHAYCSGSAEKKSHFDEDEPKSNCSLSKMTEHI
jgi:hypothetical protein